MILFVLPAASIYDRQKRAVGWKQTPASRDSMKELKALVPRLKELGPTKVIGSDLDHDSVWILGKKLGVPYAEFQALRRLNAGKLHGAPISKLEETIASLPKDKPDVPIKGGDSLTSYSRRMAHARELLAAIKETAVVVAAPREIGELIGIKADGLQHGRVYQWDHAKH